MASVSDGGGTALTLSLNTNESLTVVASGSTYVFSTNQTFTNGKVADAASDFSAFGGASLTLRAPGLNRYVWDMRYDGEKDLTFQKQPPANEFFTRGEGPRVLPGEYRVSVTVKGRTESAAPGW